MRQKIGDRAEHVGAVVPDVAAAVAVVIDRIAQKGRRHELALAHRPGPRAGHVADADIALVDDAQGRDQLAAEIGPAPPVEAKRGERRHHHVIAGDLAEIAFHPPQSDDKARLDIVAPPDRVEQAPIVVELAARILDALRAHRLLQILGEGQHLLGLVTVELDDMRQVLGIAQRQIDRRRANALRRRLAPDRGEERVEIALGCRRRQTGEHAPERRSTASKAAFDGCSGEASSQSPLVAQLPRPSLATSAPGGATRRRHAGKCCGGVLRIGKDRQVRHRIGASDGAGELDKMPARS